MRIAVIGAMEEEVRILRDKLEQAETETVAGCEFTKGTLAGHEVILLKSGIGKVNAAMSTTILLERYQPEKVINTGSAGGFHQSLNVGDVVISTEVRHHDVDVTAFDYEYGQVPGMPPGFKADEELVTLAEKCMKAEEKIQVVKGMIATGDSFMSDPNRVAAIRDKFENLYAVEMEAAAVAQVCHQYKVPFVIIRALSDIAGKESDVSFDQFLDQAALHSTNFIVKVLEELK
ncbi:5'-methylthioadenosine/S-adenosylhomocysteine nucleosidase [Bacillus gaemokensis]|uniref:5'-methylthioadenosine/S-adenosylhomocysteine nucleosidase n=1 Tax=Bacillus gaemokensis TaxID=574375 RepID=A0A073KV86_9BACI|nr:5'-methylthioadenosine/S-adenosylhomocysteine nucleosidase [Bacillus gaemokensis]KEK26303.1 5'-methylthioadenosine nucleosidase [Bacillus gaemokensis]KYG39108.1 5'-methylthioadenosine nucleosidase [Bacillus gaemokensis]